MITLAALSIIGAVPQDYAGDHWFHFFSNPNRLSPFALLHIEEYDGRYPDRNWEIAFSMGERRGYRAYRLRGGAVEETDTERCDFRLQVQAIRDLLPAYLWVPGADLTDRIPGPPGFGGRGVGYTLIAQAAQAAGTVSREGNPMLVTLRTGDRGALAEWGAQARAVLDDCEWVPSEGWTIQQPIQPMAPPRPDDRGERG